MSVEHNLPALVRATKNTAFWARTFGPAYLFKTEVEEMRERYDWEPPAFEWKQPPPDYTCTVCGNSVWTGGAATVTGCPYCQAIERNRILDLEAQERGRKAKEARSIADDIVSQILAERS